MVFFWSDHVVTTKRRYKDQVYCTHLLRRSYREDGKVKNETLGNLSHLPDSVIDLILLQSLGVSLPGPHPNPLPNGEGVNS